MRPFASAPFAFLILLCSLTSRTDGQTSFEGRGSGITIRYEQKDAATVERRSLTVSVSATVRLGDQSTRVEILHPSGIRHTLPRTSSNAFGSSHGIAQTFATWAELRAQFPPGTWSLVANTGFSVATSQVGVPEVSTEYIPKMTNYDELQQYTGGKIRLVWQVTPPGSRPIDQGVSLNRLDGRNIFGAGADGSIEYDLQDRIAPGETVNGELSISRTEPVPTQGVVRSYLQFSVKRLPDTPAIVRQPSDVSVAEGDRITLSVSATGPNLRYQWLKDGSAISGSTSSSLEIAAAKLSDAGAYSVRITNDKGEITSNAARVVVNQIIVPPTIVSEPVSVTATVGARAQFQVTAEGTALAYQWHRNGATITDATSATLTLSSVRASDTGSYTVTVSNGAGSRTTAPATLSVDPVTRISNLSIRAAVGGEIGLLTVGLTLGGEGAAGSKQILVRAIGPTLSAFGVPGALPDPSLTLLSGANVVSRNDNWSGNPLVTSTSSAVGAFHLSDATSKDAALVFPTSAGSYTMQVDGTPGGVALAEIYDATSGDDFTLSTLRLINVSALTQVGTGSDTLIAGFSIAGTKPRTVLIRAIGPALAAFGVPAPLGDPRLDLYRAGIAEVHATNDNWSSAANATDIAATAARVGAFALTTGSRDAVILVSLHPGSYTAQVSGVGGLTGKALVEVYEVP